MPVDLLRSSIEILIPKLPPSFVPPATAWSPTVDLDVDMLGNDEGELVDVLHSTGNEPLLEISRLREDVMTHIATWRKNELRRLGIEVAVEPEGQNRCRIIRPP
jgi:hypothetical protein